MPFFEHSQTFVLNNATTDLHALVFALIRPNGKLVWNLLL